MKTLKLRLPKIKVKVKVVLWLVFALAIFLEVFVLYKYLYLNAKLRLGGAEITAQTPSLRIDFEASNWAKSWFDERASYSLPDYDLETADLGRENPFAEY